MKKVITILFAICLILASTSILILGIAKAHESITLVEMHELKLGEITDADYEADTDVYTIVLENGKTLTFSGEDVENRWSSENEIAVYEYSNGSYKLYFFREWEE